MDSGTGNQRGRWTAGQVHREMNGQRAGGTEQRMETGTEKQMGRETDGHRDRWQMDSGTDRQRARWTDRRAGRMDREMDEQRGSSIQLICS